jgi:hypothetical protein
MLVFACEQWVGWVKYGISRPLTWPTLLPQNSIAYGRVLGGNLRCSNDRTALEVVLKMNLQAPSPSPLPSWMAAHVSPVAAEMRRVLSLQPTRIVKVRACGVSLLCIFG